MSIFTHTEITGEGVRIRLLGVAKTILFKDIKSVQKVRYVKATFNWISPRKPIVGRWNMPLEGGILVETQYFRWVACPKDQDEFVQLVSNHLTNSK